jgi:hypothetical protein
MSRHALARISGYRFLHAITACVFILQLSSPAPSFAQQVTMETLLDRIQIEDILVKVDGKWLISKRYISSDSGTPDRFDQTFKQRDNPLAPL